MASRRKISNFADTYLRYYLQKKAAEQQSALVGQRQRELAKFNAGQGLLEQGFKDPALFVRLRAAGMNQINDTPIEPLVPSSREAMRPIVEDLAKADSQQKVMTPADILNRYSVMPGANMEGENPEVGQMMSQQAAKENQQRDLVPPQRIDDAYNPETKTYGTRFVAGDPQSLRESPDIVTKPDPTTLGENWMSEQQAGPLSPTFAVAKAQVDNQIANLTRATRAKDAFMQANQAESGRMTPSLIDARVEEAVRKQTDPRIIEANRSTEGERRAATNVVPLINAHAKAMGLEKSGVSIKPLAMAASSSPGINSLAAGTGALSADDLSYVAAAKDFAATFTYIKSGVQSREEEYNRYVSILFALHGDPQQVRNEKAQRRTAFISAAQISMGRSKREGGMALGTSIKQGIVPVEILTTLDMDPEFRAGVMETAGIPVVGGAR